jgi:endonuclease/exonuclease/phosphatase (EEP) superfamily protein YafD
VALVLLVLGWVAAAGLVGLCVVHEVQPLGTSVAIAAIGVSPLVLPLALPLGLAAGWRRRWLLATACALVLVCWSFWAGPDFWPFSRAPAATGPGVRILDANVSQSNTDLRVLGRQIGRDDPDVVVLEELTPTSLESLEGTGALRPYRWSIFRTKFGPGGMGLWSRVPASQLSLWTVGKGQVEIEGWIHPSGTVSMRVDGIHVYAPAFGHREVDPPATWQRQLAAVRSHLAAEPRPLLVAGDFNATWDLRPFQRILHLGLSDAAVLAGRGWEMTWPRNQAFVIPYLRLDHVLLSAGLTVTSYRLGDDPGSDHRPLLVTVARRA